MFRSLVKQNYKLLKCYKGKRCHYQSIYQNASYITSRSSAISREQNIEEAVAEDSDDEDDCEETCSPPEPKKKGRVCPPDPCKPPSDGPCLSEPTPKPPPPKDLGLLGSIGPKQIAVLTAFIPGLMRYGAVALGTIIYMTEWRAVLQYLPFYNTKYALDDDVVQPKKTGGNEPPGGSDAQKKDC